MGNTIICDYVGSVNEGTICKAHDRWAYVELKNFMSKNSGVLSKNKKKLAITEFEEDSHAMGLEKDWALSTTVWDAAGYNFLS